MILAYIRNSRSLFAVLQAFKKMNKELKREQIDILKSKYGIDLEKDK